MGWSGFWSRASVISLGLWLGIASGNAFPGFWQVRQSPVSSDLRAVTSGDGLLVAVGSEQTILTSSNATDWVVRSHNPGSADSFYGVTYSQGTFVAVGSGDCLLRTSTDGIHWKQLQSPQEEYGFEANYGVASYEGLFVATHNVANEYGDVSDVTIGVAGSDSWFSHYMWGAGDTIRAITHGADRFVAVGDAGTFVFSTNGLDWWPGESGVTNDLISVTYAGDKFVTTSEQGHLVLVSSNGVSWTPVAPPPFGIRGLAYGRGAYVAVGGFSGSGRIHTSPDAITWPGTSVTAAYPMNGVAYAGGYFVAVGERGLIMQSSVPRLIVRRTIIDGYNFMELTIEGEPGRLYRIDFTWDFQTWRWGGYHVSQGARSLVGAWNAEVQGPAAFFRVVMLP